MSGTAEGSAMREPADRLARQWSSGRRPRVYDFTIRHERFFRVLSRVVWAADVRSFYADLAALGNLRDGSTVLDVPCGGGVAFRGLNPQASIRYVAADVSPLMLDRAIVAAARRGLHDIEFVLTSVSAMPFEDASFDVCLCYNGLHCFADPPAAVAEMLRVLRPGGQLRGTVVVSGGGGLSAAAIRFFQRTDQFGVVPSADEARAWLTGAGLRDVRLDRRGAWASFTGCRAVEE
jgi:SAM-dependent methyltransferase